MTSPVGQPMPEAATAEEDEARHRVPGATYRLQFNAGFTFRDATALVPYFAALGITDCYCSSYLQAVPGSPHGYDVADPTSLNEEIGSEEDFRAFVQALTAHDMSQVLDVVPNHMGIASARNRWWQDVLENGAGSRYARVFDIDWHPLKPELADKVLLPILGDSYGSVLERQEIRLEYDAGAYSLHYYDTTLPVTPRSYARILKHGLDAFVATEGADAPHVLELQSIVTSLERLPPTTEQDPALVAERQREKEVARRRLARLTDEFPSVAAFVNGTVRQFNGIPGASESFDLLDALLAEQPYRLAHWRVASEEINYRRFFDINELAAVRMEDPVVFEETHRLIFRLLRERSICGLRIDHVDGLYDPADYLRRVQAHAREAGLGGGTRPIFLVVEKILAPDEPLPADWPVDGTTGYEFGSLVNGLFIDRRHERAFDELYSRFTKDRTAFRDLAYTMKKLIMTINMASEINLLAHQLNEFSERNRHYRDFTVNSLAQAIREIIACFPVYRTYVPGGGAPVSERDRIYIDRAVDEASRRNPATVPLVFEFIRDLLLKRADYIPESERGDYLRLVARFQQTTSPVTAKGIEDTALYRYQRLVSLNEVGSDPSHFGWAPDAVHRWMLDRRRDHPTSLSTTSTHDSKRSEDVRARIDVLSEMPGVWRSALTRWARMNRRYRTVLDAAHAPDRNEECLLYQTLLGAWPLDALEGPPPQDFIERIVAYMIKALREAKRHTSWLNPRPEREDAVTTFVRRVLDARQGAAFLRDFRQVLPRVVHPGLWNSLAQTLVKITAPGVPDFYQGTEIWDFSLVDPDNRRPVDYERRRALLERIPRAGHGLSEEASRELLDERFDGRLKLHVTAAGLRFRRTHEALFRTGEYRPLDVTGPHAMHVFAFARRHGPDAALTVVPRLTTTLVPDAAAPPLGEAVWRDTSVVVPADLHREGWTSVLTGEPFATEGERRHIRVANLLGRLPVAMLASESLRR